MYSLILNFQTREHERASGLMRGAIPTQSHNP